MATRPHHGGTYQARRNRLVAEAYADPMLRCWKCRRTIDQVRHANGKPGKWTAGHVIPGDMRPDAPMRAECSVCQCSEGGVLSTKQQSTLAVSKRWH